VNTPKNRAAPESKEKRGKEREAEYNCRREREESRSREETREKRVELGMWPTYGPRPSPNEKKRGRVTK
jgi:hypothetical protein